MIFFYFLPELFLLIGIILIIIYSLLFKNFNEDFTMRSSIFIILIAIMILNAFEIENPIILLNLNLIISPFIQFLKIIILSLGIIVIYVNNIYIDNKKKLLEINILILSLIWTFLVLISTNSLILLIILMEIHGIIAFTLTGIKENSSLAKEAMIKFFILGVIASAFMGYGISIKYLMLGTININEIYLLISEINFMPLYFKFFFAIGSLFIIGGFLFKLAIVPFHFWIGDVYHGAPLGIVMLFASIPVLVYIYLFSKIIFLLNIHVIIGILVLSIGYGTYMSIYQTNLMRLIGYSAIIHISYALLGTIEGNSLSLSSGYLYIIIYCFLNLGLFIIILNLKNNKLLDKLHLIEILDFLKILKPNFLLSCITVGIFFSMAGIPPLSGFFIKMYVYHSLGISYNYLILIFLLIIGIVNAIYYIRLVRLVFFTNEILIDNTKMFNYTLLVLLVISFIINLFFFIIHIFFLMELFSLI